MVMAAWPFLRKGGMNSWWIQRGGEGDVCCRAMQLFPLQIPRHRQHSLQRCREQLGLQWVSGKRGSFKATRELSTPIEMETPDPQIESPMCATTLPRSRRFQNGGEIVPHSKSHRKECEKENHYINIRTSSKVCFPIFKKEGRKSSFLSFLILRYSLDITGEGIESNFSFYSRLSSLLDFLCLGENVFDYSWIFHQTSLTESVYMFPSLSTLEIFGTSRTSLRPLLFLPMCELLPSSWLSFHLSFSTMK